MKLRNGKLRGREDGFTLVDAMFAMAIAGIMFLALYSGLGFGFKMIKLARENSRATQIMVEKMETIRLYTWTQINTPGFLPTNKFTVSYYGLNGTNTSLLYTGRISIADCPLSTSYASNMKKVMVQLDWGQLANTNHTRTMTTYITRNGLQNYVW